MSMTWLILRSCMDTGLQIWKVAVVILNKQLQTVDKGYSYRFVVG
jgi:hypothetical protein